MISIRLRIELGHEWRFEDLPPRSIALDGAVLGPRIDPAKQRYSFDHHKGCVRLVTSATCQQVLDAMLLGLDPAGHEVLVNDLDADTVLSIWLLEHYGRWRRPDERERVRPLVASVAALDAHGPAYPAPDAHLATHFQALIMAPVRKAARSTFEEGTAAPLSKALACLESWWDSGLVPESTSDDPGPTLAVTDRGSWILASLGDDPGANPLAGMARLYEQGHDRIVLHRLLRGEHYYTLAKRSDLVTAFPLPRLYEHLNRAESEARAATLSPGETWGGGSSIGGGPRRGSVLGPERVTQVVGALLD